MSSGKFEKRCGTSMNHDFWNTSSTTLKHRSKVPGSVLQTLDREHRYRYPGAKTPPNYYCVACIEYVATVCVQCKRRLLVPKSDHSTETENEPIRDRKDTDAQTDKEMSSLYFLSNSEKEEIAYELGKSQRSEIQFDCNRLTRTIDDLKQLNASCYLTQRNKVVISFLNGISENQTSADINLRKCLAAEHIYGLASSRFIAPFSFTNNLLTYQSTQSKLITNINGKLGPAGTYYTIQNWLGDESHNPLPFPSGDCIVAFDNDQVVGKSWHIKTNNKVNVSIVTSLCAAPVGNKSSQFDKKLHPRNWFNYDGFEDKLQDIRNRTGHYYVDVHNTHYNNLYQHLNSRIKIVHEEQKRYHVNGSFMDEIDKRIDTDESSKSVIVCALCGSRYARTKIKCDKCKVNLRQAMKRKSDESPPLDIQKPQKQRKTKEIEVNPRQNKQQLTHNDISNEPEPKLSAKINALDPLPVNPNAYDTVKLVLRRIGVEANISRYCDSSCTNPRQWLFVMCDGLPYGLAHRLIHDTFYCTKCKDSVMGKDAFKSHVHKEHHSEPTELVLEFDWVVLLIGKGHLEMNMSKSFFELNWEPFLKELVKLMGFRSEFALQSAKLCRDNHKTWDLLNIFFIGATDELILPYIRQSILKNVIPTVEGYIGWCKTCSNKNYLYLHEQTFTYCQALMNFREGLRNNDFKLISSGKEKFSAIWYGRPHPKYQSIALYDTCDYFLYPSEVKSIVEENQSFQSTESKGEDLDFKLENINKKSKSWISGVPTFETWLKVFRNLDKLDELKSSFLSMTSQGEKDNPSVKNPVPADTEVKSWRTLLRSYLHDPSLPSSHTSLVGELLDPELINFSGLADRKRKECFDILINHVNEDGSKKHTPVFVTKSERCKYESIENQTKDVIGRKIEHLIARLGDEDLRDYYLAIWNSEKKKATKSRYLEIYREVDGDLLDVLEAIESTDVSIALYIHCNTTKFLKRQIGAATHCT